MNMSSAIDLEYGQGAQTPLRAGVEGSDLPVHGSQSVVSQAETLEETSSSDCCCIPSRVFRPFTSMRGRSNIGHSQRNVSDQSTQTGQGPSQAGAQIPVASNPAVGSGPLNTTSDSESEEPRMIGDFDGSASEFWKLFTDEAKNHDDSRINTLKDGMDSALIFAGLFSAALTAFVVDSKQKLSPNPADEMVYYLQQHSTILSQISVQLSSIAPQVVIPSTPPPPFTPFTPLASDVRVNIFWFMALAFSLTAALLAILVQQWVRKYMHVFKRYGDPLKCSRLRQYLYDGYEGWYMPRVAEAVPGFLHVSLFLFSAGLGDSLLKINTKVALTTIVPVGASGLLYILMTFVPIIFPQSPYQNSFTGIFWYLLQKSCVRRFAIRRSDRRRESVSTNMADGQMQLAMEETEACKDRDERAIRWLIDNLTEDAEMEKFVSAIPGSFNTDWGREIWERVGIRHRSEDQSRDEPVTGPHIDTTARQPAPHPPNAHPRSTTAHVREDVVHELGKRVARSVEICKNRNLFSDEDLWLKRTHACIETAASLVCCANAELSWFGVGDISKVLGYIGSSGDIRKLSSEGKDELFVTRWTCLSLVAIQQILEDEQVQSRVTQAMEWFKKADDTGKNDALAAAQKIDKTVQKASDCLFQLYDALQKTEDLTKEVKEILHAHKSQISDLERINIEANRLNQVDTLLLSTQNAINATSHHITSQFDLDDFDLFNQAPTPSNPLIELSGDRRKMPLQFIRPGQTLKSMCSPATLLRNILEGRENADAYKQLLKNLKNFRDSPGWQGDEMQRQLWRLQDLRYGGRLGFTVELFFLALDKQFTSSSKESHSALYTGTFRAIISDWSKHKHLPGTQNLIFGIAASHRQGLDEHYPDYIVKEFFSLLSDIPKDGQAHEPTTQGNEIIGKNKRGWQRRCGWRFHANTGAERKGRNETGERAREGNTRKKSTLITDANRDDH